MSIIMDNSATHKTPATRAWFARRPRWHVHFTPTGASWLNMVERFFAEITERQIRRGVHISVKNLESAIDAYTERHNEDPRPCTWVRTADDILAPSSASAFESAPTVLLRTSDSGH